MYTFIYIYIRMFAFVYVLAFVLVCQSAISHFAHYEIVFEFIQISICGGYDRLAHTRICILLMCTNRQNDVVPLSRGSKEAAV